MSQIFFFNSRLANMQVAGFLMYSAIFLPILHDYESTCMAKMSMIDNRQISGRLRAYIQL